MKINNILIKKYFLRNMIIRLYEKINKNHLLDNFFFKVCNKNLQTTLIGLSTSTERTL